MNTKYKDNRGTIKKVDPSKKRGENSPDYTGAGTIDGKEKFISGWRKVDENNNLKISLSFTDKDSGYQKSDDNY